MSSKDERRDPVMERQLDIVIQQLRQLEQFSKVKEERQIIEDQLHVTERAWADMEAYAREKNQEILQKNQEILQLTEELNFCHNYFDEHTKKLLRPFFKAYRWGRKTWSKIRGRNTTGEAPSVQTPCEENADSMVFEPVDEQVYHPLIRRVAPHEKINDIAVTVSVVIPAYNGGEQLLALIGMLYRQAGCPQAEIIVVDSGSDDGTLPIMRWLGVRVIEIPHEEFSHSYARNLGAKQATGDLLLFMTQDAMPEDECWLYHMLQVWQGNDNVVAITPMEKENAKGDLKYKVDSWMHARYLGAFNDDKIGRWPSSTDFHSIRQNAQLSDVACLIDREIFTRYQYQGDYAEDLDLGIRLLQDGYEIALLSSVRVIHSHNRPCGYYLRRAIVDHRTLAGFFQDFPVANRTDLMLQQEVKEAYTAVLALIGAIQNIKDDSLGLQEFCRKVAEIAVAPLPTQLPEDTYADAFIKKCLQALHVSADLCFSDGEQIEAPPHIQNYVKEYIIPYLITKQSAYHKDLKDEVCLTIYKTFAGYVGTLLAEYDITHPQEDAIKKTIQSLVVGI